MCCIRVNLMNNVTMKVIDFMPGQSEEIDKGGTPSLGEDYPLALEPEQKMEQCYGNKLIHERHRHRYEFNNKYREELMRAGLVISGTSPDDRLVETAELKEHPFFVVRRRVSSGI